MQPFITEAIVRLDYNKKAVDTCPRFLDMSILSIAFFIGKAEYRIDYMEELIQAD